MSEKDARKITIIGQLIEKNINVKQAAELLELSTRQIMRLKAEANANGTMSILHKNRGRKPSNALSEETVNSIIGLYKSKLKGYNFCHTADVLAEDEGIYVSASTVTRLLKSNGIKSPKSKRRPKKHRSRTAREYEGEMAQMDASPYDWLVDGQTLHLHGVIDDATGRVLALHLDNQETLEGYCECMFFMNKSGHVPRELYTDRRTVFYYDSKVKKKLTIAEELAGVYEKEPHFARSLKELGVILILANSAQGKGRIERLWETLQDRLSKDFRRKGISNIDEANKFLHQYLTYYNRKFSVTAASSEKKYIEKISEDNMHLMFSKREFRKLDSGISFSYHGVKYQLPMYSRKESPSPSESIIVATSHRIGIKVLYKGIVMNPLKIEKRKHIAAKLAVIKPSRTPYKPAKDHPWRNCSSKQKPNKRTGDIIADELRP